MNCLWQRESNSARQFYHTHIHRHALVFLTLLPSPSAGGLSGSVLFSSSSSSAPLLCLSLELPACQSPATLHISHRAVQSCLRARASTLYSAALATSFSYLGLGTDSPRRWRNSSRRNQLNTHAGGAAALSRYTQYVSPTYFEVQLVLGSIND